MNHGAFFYKLVPDWDPGEQGEKIDVSEWFIVGGLL